jgi:hypothetical protein
VTTKKEMKAAEVLANQRSAFEKKVRALLGHVGGRVKKAELDAGVRRPPVQGRVRARGRQARRRDRLA